MISNWQDAIVVAAVVLAASYVARRAWLVARGRRQAGCHGCGTCPSNQTGGGGLQARTVLRIDPPARI
jgi:hypothetical protein